MQEYQHPEQRSYPDDPHSSQKQHKSPLARTVLCTRKCVAQTARLPLVPLL